jgi:hypothetical protein
VLLQQTRLQLLQALAAPVQQLQLLLAHQQQQQKDSVSGAQVTNVDELCQELQAWSYLGRHIGQVLFMLDAAASGLAAPQDTKGKPGPVCLHQLCGQGACAADKLSACPVLAQMQ